MIRRKRSLKSALLRCWIFAVLLPMIIIECFTLVQVYRLNYEKIDTAVKQELLDTQKNINQIIRNMAAMSQQLASDGNIGKNLYYYFNEMDVQKKTNLLIYLREQIATYEAANPTLGNITYFLKTDTKQGIKSDFSLDKINKSSLAQERLPEQTQGLMSGDNVQYYGPHPTASAVSSYSVISLVRSYKMTHEEGEILIYIESGYRTLEKLLPVMKGAAVESSEKESSIYGMDAIFTIISDQGNVLYTSNEEKIPKNQRIKEEINEKNGKEENEMWKVGGTTYRTYYVKDTGQWQLCAMIPLSSYNEVLYGAMLSFLCILVGTVLMTILIFAKIWKGVSLSVQHFEQNLKQIDMGEHVECEIKYMNILEFDESIAIFERLRGRIIELLQKVQKQEAEKYSLEVKSLLGKINPHFLNNTLDTLKWYAQERGESGIVRFITDLNKLLIYNMNKSKVTTLESELEAVQSYIALQKWKYDISFLIEIEAHSQLLKADMPRFLLQPLVENAILHGNIPGEICIKIFLQTDGLIAVHILNKGKQMETGLLEKLIQAKDDLASNGIGVQYVIRSLENRFGSRYRFEMGSIEEEGINFVKISIPFELAKQEERKWRK